MRLAFITSLLPSKLPDTGFEIANACVLAALKDAGIEVIQFGFLRNTEQVQVPTDQILLDKIVIENAIASRWQKLRWLLSSLMRGLPVISTKLAAFGEDNLIRIVDQHGPFDAYVLNSAPIAGAFPRMMKRKPSILLAHNVEHLSARENAMTTTGFTSRLYAREARLLQTIEQAAIDQCRFVWCFSEEDRQGFGINIDARSAVLPLLIPNQTIPQSSEIAYDVGLIGTWTWQPNLVGLKWFTEEVAPLLPDDIKIGIAGRLPEGFQIAAGNIDVLGRVPDAAAFVGASRVIALASRTGTGIQLKTIETLQAGKAAVATPSSVRGLGALPETCLVAENATDFAAALVKLVRDIRSGRTSASNSEDFIQQRKDGMTQAIKAGLDALKK